MTRSWVRSPPSPRLYLERIPMNKPVVFCGGFVAGVVTTKVIPKTKIVKHTKFIIEVFKARQRLQKICIEEYERLDMAMDTEQKFLNMMSGDLVFHVIFKLVDEAGQRNISFEVKTKDD
jgi:hypothetical protein